MVTYAGIAADVAGQSGSFTKTGNGELDLSGANTFTGGLKVNGGAVKLTNAAAAGTAPIGANTGGETCSCCGNRECHQPECGGTLGVTGGQTISGSLTVSGNAMIDTFDPITGTGNMTSSLAACSWGAETLPCKSAGN